jgi:hypothetical protein
MLDCPGVQYSWVVQRCCAPATPLQHRLIAQLEVLRAGRSNTCNSAFWRFRMHGVRRTGCGVAHPSANGVRRGARHLRILRSMAERWGTWTVRRIILRVPDGGCRV